MTVCRWRNAGTSTGGSDLPSRSLKYRREETFHHNGGIILEPLETRIARLTPEQQREVSDFVDFLLLKNTIAQPGAGAPPSLIMVNTPPVMMPDPVPVSLSGIITPPDPLITLQSPAPVTADETSPPLIQEILGGSNDGITSDYIDYGKYEEKSSPATDAARNTKKRVIARQDKDKPGHILDWVD